VESVFKHSEILHPIIQEALQDASITFNELDALSVTSGPGSYTSLRVGLAAAKGFCAALNIPLLSIGSLKLLYFGLAYHNIQIDECDWVASMIDARRNDVYLQLFDKSGQTIKKEHLQTVDEEFVRELGTNRVHMVGSGSFKANTYEKGNFLIHPEVKINSKLLVAPVYEKYLNKEFENLGQFIPFYVTDPNITKSKKKLF
jgi:tRNA threonylcarbamoyladenosine biosynthesis protein TsaB